MNINLSKEIIGQLKDQVSNILEFCQMHKIPMFVAFCIENNNENTRYYNQIYSAKANNINLFDDQIEKHLLIANGFAAVPKRESVEIDMSIFSEDIPDLEDDVNTEK